MSSSCAEYRAASGKLQVTLADMALLILGIACGLWHVRSTGILRNDSLPNLTYTLLLLDYFIWGLSFVGPAVVLIDWTGAPHARKSAGDVCLFWLGAINLGIHVSARLFGSAGLSCLITFLFFRYHFGYLILLLLSLYVLTVNAAASAASWPKLFGLLVLVGQTLGSIGFRLAPIDTVIEL